MHCHCHGKHHSTRLICGTGAVAMAKSILEPLTAVYTYKVQHMPCEELTDVQIVEYLGIPSLDGKTTTTVRCYTPHKKNSRISDGLVGALVYIQGGNHHQVLLSYLQGTSAEPSIIWLCS